MCLDGRGAGLVCGWAGGARIKVGNGVEVMRGIWASMLFSI